MRMLLRIAIWVVVAAAGVAVAAGVYFHQRGDTEQKFRTTPVRRGTVVSTISATGTVEPEEVVDVGAQIAGQINSFGKDKDGKMIDYGSVVEVGTILAQIDDALYAAQLAQAQAQLVVDRASVTRAQADLEQMKAKLDQATRDWGRAQKLGPSDALSQEAYDGYKAAFEVAQANVASQEAVILFNQATVVHDEAAVQYAQTNVHYCTITSPVKGVIIDRRVNIGQTVVSSLSAPSLFLLARDLKRMQVWVSVNEADIGNIHPGQTVTFTVDAFPGQTFKGTVGKIRLNATMTQNVVTYTVEVVTDNSDGKLLPYLTANAQFDVARHENVLTVPNAALRWMPRPEEVAPDARQDSEETRTSPAAPAATAGKGETSRGRVWVPDGKYARPVRIRLGITDGVVTEVQGGQLEEGELVVIGAATAPSGDAGGAPTNPFTPQLGKPQRPPTPAQ